MAALKVRSQLKNVRRALKTAVDNRRRTKFGRLLGLERRKSKIPFVERKIQRETGRLMTEEEKYDRRGKLFSAERIKSSVTDKGKHGSGKPYVTEVWKDLQKGTPKKRTVAGKLKLSMLSSSKHSTEIPYSRGVVLISSETSRGRIRTDRRSRKGAKVIKDRRKPKKKKEKRQITST